MKKHLSEVTETEMQSGQRGQGTERKVRDCNLCRRPFKASTAFKRYCDHCRHQNEIYKTIEWLPAGAICL